MAQYAVPALVKIPAIVVVDADSAADAKRKVSAGEGHVMALACNSVGSVSDTEGASIRKGAVRRVDSELNQTLDEWDNDQGVPW